MAKRKSKVNKAHYVDNAKFLEAMIEYKREYNKSKESDTDLPMISEYLGSDLSKITNEPVPFGGEAPSEYPDVAKVPGVVFVTLLVPIF